MPPLSARFAIHLVVVGLVLLMTGCSSVMRAPCEAPRISNRWAPSAYLVKLPLAATDPERKIEGQRELDTLIDARAIAMAFEVGDTHLTLLDARGSSECDIADVYDSVTANRLGLFTRRLFHSAVFLWGDVYGSDDGELYVKLYMRVFWNGSEGTARVVYDGSIGEQTLVFRGRFPASTISFPRRRLDAATVKRLKDDLRHLQARALPSADAPVVELTHQFAISSSDKGWLKLTSLNGTQAWVTQTNVVELAARLLPELEFAQGVLAYLNFKVSGDPQSARRSLASLDIFRNGLAPEASTSGQLQLPMAIADVIAGSLGQARAKERATLDAQQPIQSGFQQLDTRKSLNDELKEYTSLTFTSPEVGYERAQAHMPTDSDILTLSALGLILDCCQGADTLGRVERITQWLTAAREIDSSNPVAVENLLSWYRLLQRLDPAALPQTRQQIDNRAASLQRIVEGR